MTTLDVASWALFVIGVVSLLGALFWRTPR